MSNTLLALYEDIPTAQKVLSRLQVEGFDPDSMSLMAHDAGNLPTQPHEVSTELSTSDGRNFGAIVGGLTGLLAGLIMITLPGLGPIVVAGPLAAVLGGVTGTLIGVGAGALTGGLSMALAEMNVPKSEADRFAEGVLKGNVLIAIEVTSQNVNHAIHVMSEYLPIDIQYRRGESEISNAASDPDDTVRIDRDVPKMKRHARAYDREKVKP